MYNYQTFCRQQHLQKNCRDIRKELLRAEWTRERVNTNLVLSRDKRVEGFLLQSIDSPILVGSEVRAVHCFRSSSTEGRLGACGIYLRRERQSERIKNAIERNGGLDTLPTGNCSEHQFRNTQGNGWRYQSSSELLRIQEEIDRQTLNYLNNPTTEDYRRKKAVCRQLKTSKKLSKAMLPELHRKTYFKSVNTLFVDIPKPDSRILAEIQDQMTELGELETLGGKARDESSSKQTSKQALVKCKLLPQKLRY